MNMMLLVGLGGALGSMLRYGVMLLTTRFFGVAFPYGTLCVNVLGSLAMGVLIGWGAHRSQLDPQLRNFIAVGVLGGFTTFSTFSLDVVTLFQRDPNYLALAYIMLSVTVSVIALMLGMTVMRP
jgi:CrcB protein